MQRRDQFLQGLLELHRLPDPATRRSAWRSSIAGVARACADGAPSPLDGISPAAIVDSVKVALQSGLIDDLDWLAAASAAAALYEIAAVLPPGPEKREVGRRVLSRLLDGNAAAFVALATRMAMGAGKGLSGAPIRSRVALLCALPPSLGVRVDPLAVALASRRELAREWYRETASGSLPDRRMCARLVEHGARGMVRSIAQGDDRPLRAMRGEVVLQASARLLSDREPLVWRHVAVARGLLAPYEPAYLEAIERGFAAELTPTEWRRSATSLTAHAAVRPDFALKKLREVLAQGFLKRDPGAISAFLWGIPAAAEAEPEIAEAMLDVLVASSPSNAAEALVEVLAYGPGGDFGKASIAKAREALSREPTLHPDADDGAMALRTRLLAELGPAEARERAIVDAIHDGLVAYVTEGARQAFAHGAAAVEIAETSLATLEALDTEGSDGRADAIARRAGFLALRDIDTGALEDGLARDLCVLGGRAPEAQKAISTIDAIDERVTLWVMDREQIPTPFHARVEHATVRLRRLRTLLHLADAGARGEREEAAPSTREARARCVVIARMMIRLLGAIPPPVLHRTITATLARALDALLRDEVCDPADVLLVVAQRGLAVSDVETLIEASMHEDLRVLLRAYVTLARGEIELSVSAPWAISSLPGSMPPPSMNGPASSLSMPPISSSSVAGRRVAALVTFARSIVATSRAEALRSALMRLGRVLAQTLAATSLTELSGVGGAVAPIADFEIAVSAIAQLTLGARQRLGDPIEGHPSLTSTSLAAAVDATLQSGEDDALLPGLAATREEVTVLLPAAIAEIVIEVLQTLPTLPITATLLPRPADEPEPPLPAWLPARRIIGGFYVVRALGAGTGGTVFMARRIEDRNDSKAERFALKVPDYDGNAARTLSEDEFLQLFREEAVALLGMPKHPSIATFVTFDLAARPKPILVMELVEGLSVDRVVRSAALDVPRAFELLDGVLAGLEAMHKAGIGHLDVKPSNVIVRAGTSLPVLVDFGLAGRHIRPGCATLGYGAPEVWGVVPEGHEPTPMGADIYAFGSMAFELLTSHELFDVESEMATITAHISHDGMPPRLAELAKTPRLAPLCEVLSTALRRDPRQRASVTTLRKRLSEVAKTLPNASWPIVADRRA